MKKLSILSIVSIIAYTPQLNAGSFQLNLQGLKQASMASTGTAIPWDIATLFYNPAGLSNIDGFQVYASSYFVSPSVRYIETPTGDYYQDVNKKVSTPFAAYIGGNLKKIKQLGFGVGIYTPFGSSADWGNDWRGRYIVQKIALQSIFVQPTVSYAITNQLSIGAGFVYAFGSVEIDKALPVSGREGDGQANLKGNANGMGYNLGIQYKANEQLHLGLNYRSAVNMKVKEGSATFTAPASLSSNFPNTQFTTELPLPAVLTLGIGFKASQKLTLQTDLVYAFWSSYDSLSFDFANNDAAVQDTHDPRLYKNTFAIRLGANYKFDEAWQLMAGVAYDPTPSNKDYLSPDAIDANRYNITAGLTYNPTSKLAITAGIYYTTTPKREVNYTPANFSGAYKINSLAPGIAISYTF